MAAESALGPTASLMFRTSAASSSSLLGDILSASSKQSQEITEGLLDGLSHYHMETF